MITTTMLRVLVVDDDRDTRATECALLRTWGYETAEAADGPTALSLAASFHPDVVLLDLRMPGIDGYEVARQLRALPGLAKTLLVAISGLGQPEDVQACLQAGCDLHLVKPSDPLALQELLALRARQTTT
jgi:two-component system, chemotaxis family, CheB/CheR fusion protein